jgi:hypothetical protein
MYFIYIYLSWEDSFSFVSFTESERLRSTCISFVFIYIYLSCEDSFGFDSLTELEDSLSFDSYVLFSFT